MQFNNISEPCRETRGDGLSLCFQLDLPTLTNRILLFSESLRATVHKVEAKIPKQCSSRLDGSSLSDSGALLLEM